MLLGQNSFECCARRGWEGLGRRCPAGEVEGPFCAFPWRTPFLEAFPGGNHRDGHGLQVPPPPKAGWQPKFQAKSFVPLEEDALCDLMKFLEDIVPVESPGSLRANLFRRMGFQMLPQYRSGSADIQGRQTCRGA